MSKADLTNQSSPSHKKKSSSFIKAMLLSTMCMDVEKKMHVFFIVYNFFFKIVNLRMELFAGFKPLPV